MPELVKSTTRRSPRTRTVTAAFAAALIAASALGGLSALTPATPAAAQTILSNAPANGFADLVDKVMPSVISVEVKYHVTDDRRRFSVPEFQFGPDNPLRRFFDNRNFRFRPPTPRAGQGSGFIISEDGYAVTNNHVVKGADEVRVKTNDGGVYDAKVVGTDPKTDLALLKIKAEGVTFKPVKFADKDPRVGEWVIAVGNPFGFSGSVTTGIISARGRKLGSGPYDNYLQIDAPINHGNSGGPAFNLNGEVIGVNTAIYSRSGGNVGIGFAIPASIARDVINDLKTKGKVVRGWLGVQIQNVTRDIAKGLKLKTTNGALVADVTPDSPALAAGLRNGDIITHVNGDKVTDTTDLATKIARIDPGTSASLTVLRGGKERTVKVKIGTMPSDRELAKLEKNGKTKPSSFRLGLLLAPADDGRGVVITDVAPGSPAARKRLRRGDVILEVSGVEVDDPAAVRAAVKAAAKRGDGTILLLVRSGDRQRYVALDVG